MACGRQCCSEDWTSVTSGDFDGDATVHLLRQNTLSRIKRVNG
jgi:hypothetical protein